MKNLIKKSIFCILFIFIVLFSLIPVEILATDDRTPLTLIEGELFIPIYGSPQDPTVDDVTAYGFNISSSIYINASSDDHGFGSYRLWYDKLVDGNWIYYSDLTVDTITSGKWRMYAYISPDSYFSASQYKIAEDVVIKINGETWNTKNYYCSDTSSSICVYKEFTVDEPEYFNFVDSSKCDIGENVVNKAIDELDVSSNADGGIKPYTFTKVSGPSWITVSTSGKINGTPVSASKTNENLVVRVTDSASPANIAEITIGIGETLSKDPNSRITISNVNATSTDIEECIIIGAYNYECDPTITVDSSSYPVYFDNGYWEVKASDNTWKHMDIYGTFEAGKIYRYCPYIYIKNDDKKGPSATAGDEYKLSKDLTVTLNGEKMQIGYVTIDNHSSTALGYTKGYSAVVIGDINGDGAITKADKTLLFNYTQDNTVKVKNADVNADGRVDYQDYLVLKNYLAGTEDYETLPKRYILYGDVNHDYKISKLDKALILKYVKGEETTIDSQGLKNADVNDDGVIDYQDYLVLKNYLAGTTGYEELPKEYIIYGDVNHDYNVNKLDKALLLKYVTEGADIDYQGLKNADVNADGRVDYQDYLVLKNYLAGTTGYETLPKTYIMYGDVNHDYKISKLDKALLLKYVKGEKGVYVYGQKLKNADVNADGIVDYQDYIVLKNYLAGTEGYETLPKTYIIYGDVNHDYKISKLDKALLLKYVKGEEVTIDSQGLKNADVNDDGVVDYKDYLVIKNYLAGIAGYETLPHK